MKVAVLVPMYNVKKHIIDVIEKLGPFIAVIYLVDDLCPQFSGKFVQENSEDPRVKVIFHNENKGVGGAMITAYKEFLEDGIADIAVKVDGDGQMDPKYIKKLIAPIVKGEAEYTKGNRFFNISGLRKMPKIRLFGNSGLSLVNKFVNGYWNIMDPTNGFTAIHKDTLEEIEFAKLDERYFFESDMLFRLGIARAVVKDISIDAVYEDEESNLRISRILFEFPPKYFSRFFKRLFYNYVLRDFNAGSLQLILGAILFVFGTCFGIIEWLKSISSGEEATAGTIMLAALPIIMGFQLLLGFLNYDIQNVPKK